MPLKRKILVSLMFIVIAGESSALSLLHHPECAEKNSIFIDVGFSSISFNVFSGDPDGFRFGFPMEMRLDYMLPVPLPVSLGIYMITPDPNLKHFGLRASYHIDLENDKTDLYFSYVFDFGFLREGIMLEYNDTPAELRFYDFRIGARRLFGSRFALTVETGFKLWALSIMASIKVL